MRGIIRPNRSKTALKRLLCGRISEMAVILAGFGRFLSMSAVAGCRGRDLALCAGRAVWACFDRPAADCGRGRLCVRWYGRSLRFARAGPPPPQCRRERAVTSCLERGQSFPACSGIDRSRINGVLEAWTSPRIHADRLRPDANRGTVRLPSTGKRDILHAAT